VARRPALAGDAPATRYYGVAVDRYVIRGGAEGFARLRALASFRLPDTQNLLDRLDIRDGWTCADLGSGSGDITVEIAHRVAPSGTVTGFDMDETKLELARELVTEHGLHNVHFEVADLRTWTAFESYDLVYCGLVLQHLRDPVELIRRMWAAVRPGGYLVVEDADFDGLFCYPPCAAFEFYAARYQQVLRSRGGDPAVGHKLYRLFLEARITDPQVKLVQRAETGEYRKSMAPWTLTATADAIVEQNLATRAEIDEAVTQLRGYVAEPGTLVGDPRIFQVWAGKPVVKPG
jgi:ubiquinone/menaquinone biosynthesis C-methylase UbiE